MRAILVLLVIVVVAVIAAIALGFIDVRQTREASLPTIKVEGGQAPAYDVQTANVSVTNEQHVVSTPRVNVEKPR